MMLRLTWRCDMLKQWRSVAGFVLGSLVFVTSVAAVDISVGLNGDYTTIQAAINAANLGDRIIVEEGTYFENITFTGIPLIVQSSDPNDTRVVEQTIIDGSAADTVITFNQSETLSTRLDGFVIQNGSPSSNGGGILCDNASPTIRRCIIRNNNCLTGDGAGIYCDQASPIIEHCIIRNNNSSDSGGGIACNRSSPTLFNCLIENNDADFGAGIWAFNSDSIPVVDNSTIANNLAIDDGGGLYCILGSSPVITNTIFWNNSANNSGDEIFNVTSTPTFLNCDVAGSGGSGSWDSSLGTDLGNNIDADPNFVIGLFGNYYLAQTIAGDSVTSPCVDVGSNTAVALNLQLFTTRSDDVADDGVVDLGYHYFREADDDNDTVANFEDNCPAISNPAQEDFDSDNKGDVCDTCPEDATDTDTDLVEDLCDNCKDDSNADQADADSDGVGDVCDNCVNVANADQADIDNNNIGDACDEPFVDYEVIDLGTLGGTSSKGYGVNDNGQVVGESRVGFGQPLHAFVWQDDPMGGTMTDLGSSAGITAGSIAYDIDNSNMVVGQAVFTGFSDRHGSLWNNTTAIDLGTLGTTWSEAYGVNSSGQIVGEFRKVSNSRGFIWESGVMTELGTLSNSTTRAWDINDSGLIVGESRVLSATAFSAQDSSPATLTNLGTLGGSSIARGVNNLNQIVGYSQVSGVNHAFIYESGLIRDIGSELENESRAYDVNESAEIVGFAEVGGIDHAFLWRPEDANEITDANFVAIDLNDRLDAQSSWSLLQEARGINVSGHITGWGVINGQTHAFYMRPKIEPATLNVPSEYATIQSAIDAALDGDTVEIAPGTYTGVGNWDLNFSGKAITVKGSVPEDPNVVEITIIDCGDGVTEQHRAFIFTNAETTTSIVEGLTILDGFDTEQGGAIDCNDVSPTIRYCIFDQCQTDGDGGAIFCRSSNPVISDCTFKNCSATGKGGAIACVNESDANISDSTFSSNQSGLDGGAIYADLSDPLISGSTIQLNQALAGDGGGIYCFNSSKPFLSQTTIAKNQASDNGGGLSADGISSPTLSNCDIINNRSGLAGGGVYANEGNATITSCDVLNNQSDGNGGGLSFWGSGAPKVRKCIIKNNRSVMGAGGGVYVNESDSTIEQCVISANESQDEGGGLSFWDGASEPIVTNCLLTGNRSDSNGGAIYNEEAQPEISNCTVSGNRALSGAGLSNFLGTVGIINSVYWANEPDELTGFPDPNVVYSDIQLAGASIYAGTENMNVDPKFDLPGFWDPNGTPVDESDDYWVEGDYHVLIDSPLIDSGDPNRSYAGQKDLDDFPRSFETIDMGAYELRRELMVPSDSYSTIQAAVDAAIEDDVILVADGVYTGDGNRNITFPSFKITLESENGPYQCIIDCESTSLVLNRGFDFLDGASDQIIVDGFTIINGRQDYGGGVKFEKNNATLKNCVIIQNNANQSGGGIYCLEASPLIIQCQLSGNQAELHGGAIHSYRFSHPEIVNCTVESNRSMFRGGGVYADWSSHPSIMNSILWANTSNEGPQIGVANITFPSSLEISYSDVQGGQSEVFIDSGNDLFWQAGNISVDPLFAQNGFWDPNGTVNDESDDFFVSGDVHLQSTQGRWDPNTEIYVTDSQSSLCIDRGDVNSSFSLEPSPNGNRINIGRFGGTSQASLSGVVSCQQGSGDLTLDGFVDLNDLVTLVAVWLDISAGYIEDIDCDGVVNLGDLSILSSVWLSSI